MQRFFVDLLEAGLAAQRRDKPRARAIVALAGAIAAGDADAARHAAFALAEAQRRAVSG